MTRWMLVAERLGRCLTVRPPTYLRVGESAVIGRDGPVPIGADPVDPRVSGRAVTVTAEAAAWSVLAHNRNGVELHRWAQPRRLITGRERACGLRVGLRVLGDPDRQYWILLQDGEPATVGTAPRTSTITSRVPPLTPAQRETLRSVFADYLAWPPAEKPAATLLATVGRRLGCQPATVRDRLRGARRKAETLGFTQEVRLNEPGYLYTLVQGGLLAPAESDVCPELRQWFGGAPR